MKYFLLQASGQSIPDKLPKSIVYLPAGSHQISASVDGKPGTRTVTTTSETAEKLQASLMQRLGGNVRPYAGFNHTSGPASFLPKQFRWEEGRGVVLDVDWTRAGTEAIEGRDYSYFSPTMLIDETGAPFGLLDTGEVGSLTNNPAFRKIERIAAERVENLGHPLHVEDDGGPGDSDDVTNENLITMYKDLVNIGLLTKEEAEQDNALELAKTKLEKMKAPPADSEKEVEAMREEIAAEHKTETDKLSKKIDKLKAENKTLKDAAVSKLEAEASDAVTKAVKEGKIPPKDKATQDFYKNTYKADPEGTAVVLASLHANPALAEDKITKNKEGEEKDAPTGLALVAAELAKEQPNNA